MPPGFRRLAAGASLFLLAAGPCAGLSPLCLPASAQEANLGTFSDVPFDHWAYLTVELLVRKYKVMAGFPDGTFGGDRPVTRYELAAALTKVVDRMDAMLAAGQPVSAADVAAAKDALGKVALPGGPTPTLADLAKRIDKLEADLKALTAKPPRTVDLSGNTGTTWMDNTQDNLPPYIKIGLGLTLKTTLDNGVEVEGDMGGDLPAQTAGNQPATAGSGKPPVGNWNYDKAHLTVHPLGASLRSGLFKPADFFGSGTELSNHWGGIVGNGFIGPDRNTVRWGDKNVAVAVTDQFGGLKATAAITPVVVLAGLDYKLNDFLRFKLAADSDEPDWGNLFNSNRAIAHNVYAVADLGTGKLGVSVQGGLAKDLLQGSVQAVWTPIFDVQLGVGAVYRSSDRGVSEVTPGVSIFVPSYATFDPAFTFGAKEPQVVSTLHGNTGPGSLLGEQAGVSIDAQWKLEDLGYPNIQVEYNIQQPVLFYAVYDATFALTISRGF